MYYRWKWFYSTLFYSFYYYVGVFFTSMLKYCQTWLAHNKAGIYSFEFEHEKHLAMQNTNGLTQYCTALCFCPCLFSSLLSSRQFRRCLAAVIPVRMEQHVWIHSTHTTVCVLPTGMWVLYYLLHYGVLIIVDYVLIVLLVLINSTWH